jgi:gamma-glutamyltranspeptidase/glutathione hydrolase
VLDRDGNRVAATLSINYPFGAGFVAPGTGVLLNDEMDDFSARPGTPNVYGLVGAQANAIAPGKRPLSSMTPTFLEAEHGVAILGTPGGSRIISMVLLAALDFAAGSEDPASWVSVNRYHHQYLPDVVSYEPGAFSADDIKILKRLGHTLQQRDRSYGNMQAVFWQPATGRVLAASDPRGGGRATVQ